MSTILKALRKLEEERARRGEGGSGLAWDLLAPPERVRAPRGLRWVAAGLLLLLLGSGISWWLLRSSPSSEQVSGAQLVESAGAPAALPAVLPESVVAEGAEGAEGRSQRSGAVGREATAAGAARGLPASPAFLVTEIVWRPDPEARLAIIDGLPAMEGTVLDGWLVESIEAERVLFRAGAVQAGIPLTEEAGGFQ